MKNKQTKIAIILLRLQGRSCTQEAHCTTEQRQVFSRKRRERHGTQFPRCQETGGFLFQRQTVQAKSCSQNVEWERERNWSRGAGAADMSFKRREDFLSSAFSWHHGLFTSCRVISQFLVSLFLELRWSPNSRPGSS